MRAFEAVLRPAAARAMGACLLLLALSATAVDHSHGEFDAVLRAQVANGVVNYPGIAADGRFQDYVSRLADPLPRDLTREERLAFYINAYNALAIQGILNGYSPASLLGRYKFFKRIRYQMDGSEINLFDLERKVIIPMGEPRIHFALVCASYSCPPLRSEAYVASRLDSQLEEQARLFLQDNAKNKFDTNTQTAYLSKIFDWYANDFEGSAGSVQQYVAQYLPSADLAKALMADGYKLKYLRYDWRLNGVPPSE